MLRHFTGLLIFFCLVHSISGITGDNQSKVEDTVPLVDSPFQAVVESVDFRALETDILLSWKPLRNFHTETGKFLSEYLIYSGSDMSRLNLVGSTATNSIRLADALNSEHLFFSKLLLHIFQMSLNNMYPCD